ncbi:alpha/beta hydrolase [Porifericola rhodea]|uniref:alpha/beta fold hydrolase n=1 Tax=Porifericola rhodea TaxID=930972 RepID=UPI0026659F74|nr:alpha/beta hydrolase [Porifericola rhodea]WKN31117.1 alpha/beta hydrolase [Porifericola rhodea]
MSQKYFMEWGQGDKKIVFLHYFGGAADSWKYVAEKLADHFHCFALNLPGFGNTPPLEKPSVLAMAQWIQKQLVLMDIYDCSVVGHSMSAKIALQLAAQQAEIQIDRIVLVAPSPPTHEPMPQEERKRMLHHPDAAEAKKTASQASVKKLNNEVKQLAIQTQLEIDHNTWRWWLLDGMNNSIADQLNTIKQDITLIVSEDDPVISMDTVHKEIIPLLPEAELISTQGIGHLIPLEAPDWLAEQLRSIL